MQRVTHIEPRHEYHLYVEFDDGLQGEVDLTDRLFGPVFEPLKDPEVFAQAFLDEFGVVCWPNGADLAPDGLHHRLREQSDAA